MERKLTKLEHSHVEVLVTVDAKTWKDAQKKAFDKEAANVEIPGFRKGKAPENLVKSKVNQMKVMDEAINALLPVAYREIIEQDGVKPYAQPKVDITKLSDTELEIKFTIVTAPEVKLGAYKGLKIGHNEVKVDPEEVETAIKKVLSENASLVVKEDVAKEGDTVILDFAGSIDGKAFEGGSAQNYELELGSHAFIPGFEEQLVGHKAGEHVDVNVKFPENYVEELKGKDAVFACDIHEVKEKKLPELNDEFVKELKLKDVETVAQLRANKEAEIKANKENAEKRDYMDKLLSEIAKNAQVEIPDEILDNQVASRKEDFEKRISQSGFTLEKYLQVLGQKEEEFLAQIRKDALRDVTHYVIMEEIGKAEGIEITEADLEFEFARMAEQYNMKIEDIKKALSSQLGDMKNSLFMTRVEQFLTENND
ncbi:MAG: trigger factor [Bacilli bacterium]|nr:trigger factor [Bacilli bacterium]